MGHSPKQLSFHLPFVLDVCENTFVKLDKLLRIVCEGLDDSRSSTHPSINQEQECMAVATLKLLKLQVHIYMLNYNTCTSNNRIVYTCTWSPCSMLHVW